MPTINQLNTAMSVQLSDSVPVFISGSQTTRRVTVAQFLELFASNQTATVQETSNQYASPGANNFIVDVYQPNIGPSDVHLILTPLTAFALGTVNMPPAATAIDGQQVTITTTQAVTGFTIGTNGALALFGAPTTMAANDSVTMAFDSFSSSWFMVDRSVPSPVSTNTVQTLTNKTLSGPILIAAVLGQPVSGDLANCVNLPISTGVSGLAANIALFLGNPTSARLATALTDETGSGLLVFATSPVLTTPRLGTPFSGTLTNCTGLPIDTGVSGMAAGVSAFLVSPTSANMAAMLTDETGSGSNVFATGPTLTTPTINTPTITTPGVTGGTFAGGTFTAPRVDQLTRGAPVTKTAAFSVAATENWLICNGAASITVTLPAASDIPGREIMLKNIAAFTVVSATANVVPLAGGAAGTAILPATAGTSATLVSDGTNWIIMA